MTGYVAVAETDIDAPAARVWDILTSPDQLKQLWFGADVETDWQVGHPIVMSGEYGGKSFRDEGEVRSFEPGRKLAYTHRSGGDPSKEHLVTFELKPRGDATEVVVTQDGGAEAQRVEYEKTWAMMLEGVEKAVGREPDAPPLEELSRSD